jgi:hypothetical protein
LAKTDRLLQGNLAFGALSGDQSHWIGQAGPGFHDRDESDSHAFVKTFTVRLKAGEQLQLLITNDHPDGDYASQFDITAMAAHVEE